jgi:hypothetical protein
MQVHSEEASISICRALPHLADQQRVRRIGFGEVVHTQALIDRTLAEVAGGRGGAPALALALQCRQQVYCRCRQLHLSLPTLLRA